MSEPESGAKGECVCGRGAKGFVPKDGRDSPDAWKPEPAPVPYPNQTRDYNTGWQDGFAAGFEQGRLSRPSYDHYNPYPYPPYPWQSPFMWVSASGTTTSETAVKDFPYVHYYS